MFIFVRAREKISLALKNRGPKSVLMCKTPSSSQPQDNEKPRVESWSRGIEEGKNVISIGRCCLCRFSGWWFCVPINNPSMDNSFPRKTLFKTLALRQISWELAKEKLRLARLPRRTESCCVTFNLLGPKRPNDQTTPLPPSFTALVSPQTFLFSHFSSCVGTETGPS